MVKFRNLASNETLANWWDNDGNQITFPRGNKGRYIKNIDELFKILKYLLSK